MMGALLAYSITSGLMLLAMYLGYRLFLSRHNQHGFNRGVLMTIYFFAFVAAPAVVASVDYNLPSSAPNNAHELTLAIIGQAAAHSKPIWGTIAIWIFMTGVLIVAIKSAMTWIKLLKVIGAGQKIKHHDYTIVVTDEEGLAPFSWIKYVVISRKDYENNCMAITVHELKHITSRHWIDLLVAQIVCIINWFNPAAWLMRDELMLVHEYQADLAVIESGLDAQAYQILLVKKAVGSRFPSLANSLNHSKLKKRITMMYKEKSGARQKFKALALMPALALAVGLAAVPSVRAAVSAISSSDVSVSKSSENFADDKTGGPRFSIAKVSDNGDHSTVVIFGDNLGNEMTVSEVTLNIGGSTYQANSVKSEMTDGRAVIDATFTCPIKDEKATMSMKFNGKEISFDLSAKRSPISYYVQPNYSTTVGTGYDVVINFSDSTQMKGIDFIVDGKKVAPSDMKTLDPATIKEMSVEGNSIIITTKGEGE